MVSSLMYFETFLELLISIHSPRTIFKNSVQIILEIIKYLFYTEITNFVTSPKRSLIVKKTQNKKVIVSCNLIESVT